MMGRWMTAGDVLASLLDQRGLKEKVRRHTALLWWDEAVGPKIAGRARPVEIRGKTLFVDVAGSAWIHELSFLKEDILRKLNERVGGGAIEEIIFVASGERDMRGNLRAKRERRDG